MTNVLVPASAGEMLSSDERLRVAVAAFLAHYGCPVRTRPRIRASSAAQPHPGGRVGPRQRWTAVPAQDLVHRGRGQALGAQVERDPGRPPPTRDPQADHPPLHPGRRALRARRRTRGPVDHTRAPLGPVPVGPPPGSRDRDTEPFGCPAQGPALIDHTASQPQTIGSAEEAPTPGGDSGSEGSGRRFAPSPV
jgi:hypothetical protein